MSEIEKKRKIYNKNVFLLSQNNICGVVTKDNVAYKCPSNKYCNNGDDNVGICENTSCFPYYIDNTNINISKFDGIDVSRNKITNICDRKISTNSKCGLDNNNTKCPDGLCCSIKGTCGYDKESCIYISPYYSNNIIEKVNRNYYSNFDDVKNFQYNFIKQIGNKYTGNNNNNFEISTTGKCGLDLDKEKIFKCPDIQYCDEYGKCSSEYNNYNNYNNYYGNLILPDLNLNSNLMHGDKFNEEYNKWFIKKEKIQSISNNYNNNNNFEISTNGNCGIDLENEKIFKCSDNQYCNQYNKCSTDYDKYIYKKFDFGSNDLVDLSSNAIYYNDERGLKDLSSNLMHGDKFNKDFDKWLDDKIKNSKFNGVSLDRRQPDSRQPDSRQPDSRQPDSRQPDSRQPDSRQPDSRQNTGRLDSSQNAIPSNSLDCNNKKLLDSFKTFYYDKTKRNFKIVDIVKINKIDDKTCDIKYNFEGNFSGQNSRRITYQYKPDTGYVCTELGGGMSGLTTLESKNNYVDEIIDLDSSTYFFLSFRTILGIIIFIGIIAFIVSSFGNNNNNNNNNKNK
jgi:hypothetical protein